MENKDQPAYPNPGSAELYAAAGLTKRELIAAMDNTPIPTFFCRKKLSEFNERRKLVRDTEDHPFSMMSAQEMAECRASWKILMADELLKQLTP